MVLMVSVDLVYTFDSRFIYKLWVGVFYQNSDFSFLGQVFQYYLLGLKSVSVENRIKIIVRPIIF